MALVAYSDSEGSDNEETHEIRKPTSKPTTAPSTTNFSVDKSNPGKIRVNLNNILPDPSKNGEHEDAPAPKRPKVGGGAFSGFNSMLPAPKRDAGSKQSVSSKGPTKKVFSLKTGAEPGFSRESDSELRDFFAAQDEASVRPDQTEEVPIPSAPKPATSTNPDLPMKGTNFMFKPLSVARNTKKKKNTSSTAKPPTSIVAQATMLGAVPAQQAPAPKKISLFSLDKEDHQLPPATEEILDEEEPPISQDDQEINLDHSIQIPTTTNLPHTQSLDRIATDLNLTAAERRQLFGRSGKSSSTAINVVNFNTDAEYAANEELRANGETVQHNPVRAIAPGKHSLKQLVSSASGQREALEESFAAGRRNKKEAGSKYGW